MYSVHHVILSLVLSVAKEQAKNLPGYLQDSSPLDLDTGVALLDQLRLTSSRHRTCGEGRCVLRESDMAQSLIRDVILPQMLTDELGRFAVQITFGEHRKQQVGVIKDDHILIFLPF
jgi:hypothetical protein